MATILKSRLREVYIFGISLFNKGIIIGCIYCHRREQLRQLAVFEVDDSQKGGRR